MTVTPPASTDAPPTPTEREEAGRAARKTVPRSEHGSWTPGPGRQDPVDLISEQNADRLQWLVPLRHARMAASPFAFYRGSARLMATDLATTPSSGLQVQLGGDAHLANFGGYASPERQLVFDANDFDETLRGPWEWDLKRLAASVYIAAQHGGGAPAACRAAAQRTVAGYRMAMARHSGRGLLEIWYDHINVDEERAAAAGIAGKKFVRAIDVFERRARSKTSLQAFEKLTEEVDGTRRIRNNAPLLQPLRDMPEELGGPDLEAAVLETIRTYTATLTDNRRWLVEQFRPVDVALKVVGVGSVGTRCLVVLMEGRDSRDPMFLQAKEAGASVLEEHLGPSPYPHHGQRVVEGQRMVQAESDIFLGWTTGPGGRDFYVRQLRDWKGSVDTDNAPIELLPGYADICGRALARGHARSGDPVAMSAYMGKGDTFDRAITAFAEAYAAQNQSDYERFTTAIADGVLPADGSADAR
jgi:uncharacterized protein (DUF2252 family)